jgi:hypothetical protein
MSQPDQSKPEVFLMVDVECTGVIPGDYSMLSIGAVVVGQHTPPFNKSFYVEIKPLPGASVDPEAMVINKLDIEHITIWGALPEVAMKMFRSWVIQVANPEIVRPVMVSEGTFDYMWVTWYLHHFKVRSPFGPNSLDTKSMYFGKYPVRWSQTTSRSILAAHPEWQSEFKHTHNALMDAIEQAERFHRMRQS